MTTVLQIPASVSQGSVPHAASMPAQAAQMVAHVARQAFSISTHMALHLAPGAPPPHMDWQVCDMVSHSSPHMVVSLAQPASTSQSGPAPPLAPLLLLLALLLAGPVPPVFDEDAAPVPPAAPLPTVSEPPVPLLAPPAPVDVVAGSWKPSGSKRPKSIEHAGSASRASRANAEPQRIRTSRVRP
jgi:hypothetical protein